MSVRDNLHKIKKEIPENVSLVAVSKTMPLDIIMEAYDAGQRVFGENKAQEMIRKQPELPSDIKWHFIGHLQTNKVKYLAPFVGMIESIDSLKLLREVNKQALKNERIIKCLLQFHIATEESKFGLDMEEAESLLKSEEYKQLNKIKLCGVMGMATFTENVSLIRNEFRNLSRIFREIKQKYFQRDDTFREISMGMTGDYPVAIEEGSTIVRIGTAIFGEREHG
jgi:pyridoxal phosphate enzyme (YggS family)